MELTVKSIDGKEVEKVAFSVEVDKSASEQSNVLYLLNKYQGSQTHQGTHACKSRGQVRGGGAKPYRQKGTGGARRGTSRTPLRPGGGVIFGPQSRSYETSLNKKVVRLGLKSAFGTKGANITVLKSDENAQYQTKTISSFIKTCAPDAKKCLFVVDELKDTAIIKASRNLSSVAIVDINFILVDQLLSSQHVVLSAASYEKLQELFAK